MRIKKVTIKEFGLLRDLTFNLGTLNVFYGPNESGKTMIVDALIDGLFRINRVKNLFPEIKNGTYAGRCQGQTGQVGYPDCRC